MASRRGGDHVSRAELLETIDGRWVAARDLAEGDAVRTMSSQGVAGTATVAKVRARHAVAPVYNLTVRGTSRYLVGACGVVVHNKGGEGAIQPFYPPNGGFAGAPTRVHLLPGTVIDRFGGTGFSRFFAPPGTPASMRSLPPGSQQTLQRVFEVIKPLEVEVGIAQPWFGQPGGGIQYRTPVDLDVLLRRGILRHISSCGR